MYNWLFLMALAVLMLGFIHWGCSRLVGEKYQMLAVLPLYPDGNGGWRGCNLTWYGFLIASSQLFGLIVLIILLGSINVAPEGVFITVIAILIFALPAARLVAMVVEGKRHTFTVSGAFFVGTVLAPWITQLSGKVLAPLHWALPTLPVLAAMAIAYSIGEGLGRLGCISFGCCYGRPLKECSLLVQKLLGQISFVFYGPTRKVIYEGRLEGTQLVPIQGITCFVYCLTALVGSGLFLWEEYGISLVFTITASQLWRFCSERLRADFRGWGRISVYQKLSLISTFYIMGCVLYFESPSPSFPDIGSGLLLLWNPGVLLFLQGMWLLFFFVFGRSTVTSSTVSFSLIHDRL